MKRKFLPALLSGLLVLLLSSNKSYSQCSNPPTTAASTTSSGYTWNDASGYEAGNAGAGNASYGSVAGNIVTGGYNTFVGSNSGSQLNIGYYNTFLGSHSGYSNTSGSHNVFIGYKAGFNELGSNKLYISNCETATPLVYGDFSTLQLGIKSLPTAGQTLTVGGHLFTKGNLTLDQSAPYLYTGTGTLELNRYLHLVNSPDQPTASGLKAGGLLVADAFNYASPAKNNLIVKGNIGLGVGALAPSAKLHVISSTTSASDNTAIFQATGLGAGSNISHIHHGLNGDWYIRSAINTGKVVIQDVATGVVGIGTSSPLARLQVKARGNGWDDHLALESSTGNVWQMLVDGGSSNKLRIRNKTSTVEALTVETDGDIGIGNASPESQLSLAKNAPDENAIRIHNLSNNKILALTNYGTTGGTNMWGSFSSANSASIFSNSQLVIRSTSNLIFSGSNTDEHMRISTNGFVGIGNPSPEVKMDVSSTDWQLKLNNTNAGGGSWYLGSSANAWGAGGGKFLIGTSSTSTNAKFAITSTGLVGINTTTPEETMHVDGGGNILLKGSTEDIGDIIFKNNANVQKGKIWTSSSATKDMYLSSADNVADITITASGKIGINTYAPDTAYQLSVNGKVKAKEVKVSINGWSDYVFDKEYDLKPLTEVESYIQANHHLPEIPSAKEVEANGIDLGATDALLLRKIEELTLYMIEQKKEIEALKKENAEIKAEIKK